jgi:hypothetical protein
MSYEEALAATKSAARGAPAPGSEGERQCIERFRTFFASFDPDRIAATIAEVYAPKVWFDDNLKEVCGLDALRSYLVETARSVESCTVDLLDVARSGDEFYLRWRMEIRSRKLRRARPLLSHGVSHLRYDARGLIVLHRDFWDAAGGLFEHLPLLGAIIRKIKARL